MTYGMIVQRCVCIVVRMNRTAIGKQRGEKTSFALTPGQTLFSLLHRYESASQNVSSFVCVSVVPVKKSWWKRRVYDL